MTNLENVLKSRDITLPTKVYVVKALVLPVVMYGCESWIIKKAENWRIDAFELWCWRSLESPLYIKDIKSVNPKEIKCEYSLDGLMLKLKFQYFGHLMWRADTLERPWCCKKLKAGGEGDDRGWDVWMASLTQWTWVWANSGRLWWTEKPGMRQFMELQRVGHNLVTKLTITT